MDFTSLQLGFFIKSPLTVNQRVLGSSPSWGAPENQSHESGWFFLFPGQLQNRCNRQGGSRPDKCKTGGFALFSAEMTEISADRTDSHFKETIVLMFLID